MTWCRVRVVMLQQARHEGSAFRTSSARFVVRAPSSFSANLFASGAQQEGGASYTAGSLGNTKVRLAASTQRSSLLAGLAHEPCYNLAMAAAVGAAWGPSILGASSFNLTINLPSAGKGSGRALAKVSTRLSDTAVCQASTGCARRLQDVPMRVGAPQSRPC